MPGRKQKVLVGMSGGVDSSVTAALLLEQGYEVIGAFMKNWSGSVAGPQGQAACEAAAQDCGWKDERRDAMRVAGKLGIPFLTFDFEKEYRRDVIEDLFREAAAGRTPNPDVLCNKYIKFDLFLREADKLGCDFVATGHYARIEGSEGSNGSEESKGSKGTWKLLAGIDPGKDQSYFLWAIKPSVLPRVLFPVGAMMKTAVRAKARELDLTVADKKDSVGICFVGEVAFAHFLRERLPRSPGPILTADGKELGTHDGLPFYTIGQREGLGLGGGVPYYVVGKDPTKNALIVSSNFDQALYRAELTAHSCNWFRKPESGTVCQARIRYRQPLQKCRIEAISEQTIRVVFDEPQRAVTPGQSLVLYDGEEMIGGGIIE